MDAQLKTLADQQAVSYKMTDFFARTLFARPDRLAQTPAHKICDNTVIENYWPDAVLRNLGFLLDCLLPRTMEYKWRNGLQQRFLGKWWPVPMEYVGHQRLSFWAVSL